MKDRHFQYCIEYHHLNEAAIRITYPVPRTDECINFLGAKRNSRSLDASSSYPQIFVKDEDRGITAFECLAEL